MMAILLALLSLPYFFFMEVVYFIFRCRPKKEIKNQQILITGAGQGIGAQFAKQFSAMGNTVHCVDIDGELVQGVVDAIQQSGGQAHAYTCDLTKHEQVQQLFDKITTSGIFINMLINNAGVTFVTKITDMTLTQIQHSLTVNIIANLWLIKLFLPKMEEMDEGHIVNIASLAGHFPLLKNTDYCAAKAGSIHAMNQLRSTDFLDSNVKFTAVCPFFVDTKMIAGVKPRGTISPEELVKEAIIGISENREEVIVPRILGVMKFMKNFIPSYLGREMMRRKARLSGNEEFVGQRMIEKIK